MSENQVKQKQEENAIDLPLHVSEPAVAATIGVVSGVVAVFAAKLAAKIFLGGDDE